MSEVYFPPLRTSVALDNPRVLDMSLGAALQEHKAVKMAYDLRSEYLSHTSLYEKDMSVIRHLTGLAGLSREHRYKFTRMVSWWAATYLNVVYASVNQLVSALDARTTRESGFSVDEVPAVSVPWLKSRQEKPVRIAVDGDEVYGTIQYWADVFLIPETLLWSLGLRRFVLRQYSGDPNMAGACQLYRRDCKALEEGFARRVTEMRRRAPKLSHLDRALDETAFVADIKTVLKSLGGPATLTEIARALYRREATDADTRSLRRRLISIPEVSVVGANRNRRYSLHNVQLSDS